MHAMNLFLQQIICYFAAVMKHPFYISLLLGCLLGWVACTGPVIIEEGDNDINVNVDNNEGESESPIVWEPVPIVHEGTYASPYTIAEAQTLGRGQSVWIEGYIVGSVSGSMKNGSIYTAENAVASNVLLADAFPTGSEYDHLFCMPVELPNGSIERDDLNLYDNPTNYHRKLRIEGDIAQYYKVAGIKDITGYTFGDEEDEDENVNDNEDIEKEEDTPEKPEEPNDPNATRNDTLSIAEGIKMQKEEGYEQARIRGYIVGYAKGNNSIVYLDATTETTKATKENVVLADDINERDNAKVIIVKLPKGIIRDEVNLYDHPQNLHKRLTVSGMMTPYYGLAGCTGTLGAENRDRFLLE